MNIKETNLTFARSLSKRKRTNRLILHHAAAETCDAAIIHQWHLDKGWAGIGYHYVVKKDGTIEIGRPEDTVGAHATGNNADSIGICFEGNFEVETMPEAQKTAGRELVTYLKGKYGISTVQRHKDVCATACPGVNFPFDEIANGTPAPEPQPTPAPSQVNYRVRVNTSSGVNVRNGAGENCGKITAIPNGTEITITQESNGWGYASEKGGWICLKYTQRAESAPAPQAAPYAVGLTYTLQANMNVRTGPGTNYPIKAHNQLTAGGKAADPDKNGSLQKGTRVTCQETRESGNDVWMRIPSGWIAAINKGKTYVS